MRLRFDLRKCGSHRVWCPGEAPSTSLGLSSGLSLRFGTSLSASQATWKVLVNPNPIVGPDRQSKNDNHANPGFTHESRKIRNFLKNNFDGNVFSVAVTVTGNTIRWTR